MTIAISTLFFIVCIGLAIWFKKDKSFRPREFFAVSVFWILLVATPWGATAAVKVASLVGTGVQTATDTVS
ncbi:hypothetical protein, partial [Streptomyces candidus]